MLLLDEVDREDWLVLLNSVSKKMLEFDSNVFCRFKDRFFKVKETNIVVERFSLMLDGNREPRFLFYWQSDPTRFKSFDVSGAPEVRTNKDILKRLSTLMDVQAILSLPLTNNPLTILDGKVFCLSFFVFAFVSLYLS